MIALRKNKSKKTKKPPKTFNGLNDRLATQSGNCCHDHFVLFDL